MDSTQRFSNRVEMYTKYRPSYPAGVVESLVAAQENARSRVVADIGSGTGIFAKLLLPHFKKVYGIEPNDAMREASEEYIHDEPGFTALNGIAEHTGLDSASVDLITAAQAFHWFDQIKAREEFKRILKPGGNVALIWNSRLTDTPFLRVFEDALLKYSIDYDKVNHQHINEDEIEQFFGRALKKKSFPNVQEFDWEGVLGRLDSSSYAPTPEMENYAKLRSVLREAFDRFAENGIVRFNYSTELYIGRFD